MDRFPYHLLHLGLFEEMFVYLHSNGTQNSFYKNLHEETKYERHLKGKVRQDLQRDLIFLTDN